MSDWRIELNKLKFREEIPYNRVLAAANLSILGFGVACATLLCIAFVILTIYWAMGTPPLTYNPDPPEIVCNTVRSDPFCWQDTTP